MWEWAKLSPEMYEDDGTTARAAKVAPAGSAEAAKITAPLVDELWKRGYTDDDISKILGKNLMRVYTQVW